MPHKFADPQAIKNIEEEIRVCDSSVSRIRTISRGGPEALKELALQIKDFIETAKNKKDMALDTLMQNGAGHIIDVKIQERAAILNRGQEKAFEIILDMIENSDRAVRYYQYQKEQYQKELAELKRYEQRPEPK